jgi:hypothetical protein
MKEIKKTEMEKEERRIKIEKGPGDDFRPRLESSP